LERRRFSQGIKQIASGLLFSQGTSELKPLRLPGSFVNKVNLPKAMINDVARYFYRNPHCQPMVG